MACMMTRILHHLQLPTAHISPLARMLAKTALSPHAAHGKLPFRRRKSGVVRAGRHMKHVAKLFMPLPPPLVWLAVPQTAPRRLPLLPLALVCMLTRVLHHPPLLMAQVPPLARIPTMTVPSPRAAERRLPLRHRKSGVVRAGRPTKHVAELVTPLRWSGPPAHHRLGRERMPKGLTGGVYDRNADCPSPSVPLASAHRRLG